MSVRSKLIVAAGIMIGTLSVTLPAQECSAASKEECIEGHSRGQDLREKGQFSRARQLFLTCAQSSCPGLIQGDCSRFGEEIDRLLPTVSFAARDSKANDLPNTTVYVDDVQVATRLDDGKAYEIDPGKHSVRFMHDGKETVLKTVLNQGEKGRVLVATFADADGPPIETDPHSTTSDSKRSAFPLVVAGLGAAGLATGAVLVGVGLHKVPDACSISSKDCAAAPGDPVFEGARGGVSLANIGIGIGVGGAAMLLGGLVWYFVQPTSAIDSRRGQVVRPFLRF